MIYPFLIDSVLVVHFLWILFLIFGLYFVLKRSKFAYIHASGLLFSLVLNVMGWYCPLTYLEDHLRSFDRPTPPMVKSFMARTLEVAIYPDLDEAVIRKGEIIFVVMNGIVYGWALKKKGVTAARST